MTGKVNTVLGGLPTEDMGYTLIHEHVVTCCDWSLRKGLGGRYCEDDTLMSMTLKQLHRAKAAGVRTIVDGTPINLGRDIAMIREAARQTGMNIIASSGFYHDENAVLLWKSENEIFGMLYHDCADGMGGTDSLPGILKCAVDAKGFTPYVQKLLRVSARISTELKLPVFCHTIPELRQGEQLMDIFEANGVPPSAIVCGHSGDTGDLKYLESVADRGCYLGFDRFGIETADPDTILAGRAETLFRMCRGGWTNRILISHDYAPYTGFFPDWSECRKPEYTDAQEGYGYFNSRVVPMLLEKGLTKTDIRTLTVDNPRRYFENAY